MSKKKQLALPVSAILLVVSFACNFIARDGPQDSQAPLFPTEDPYLEVQRVPLAEAKAAFDSDAAVFVDVRSATAYADAHVPGALSIPLAELDSRLGELDPDQWIITYCT